VEGVGEGNDKTCVAVLGEMSPDQVADVLARLQPSEARRLIELLPADRAALVAELLRYPAETAGGIMTNEMVVVRGGVTIADAIEAIRPSLARPNPPYMVYVVDRDGMGRLQGTLSFRDLLLADRDQIVDDVMTPEVITAGPLERAADVAYRLADHDFKALPVVGPDDTLIGVVTLDSAIAQIAPATIHRDLPKVFA
jgi:magnesium transporter